MLLDEYYYWVNDTAIVYFRYVEKSDDNHYRYERIYKYHDEDEFRFKSTEDGTKSAEDFVKAAGGTMTRITKRMWDYQLLLTLGVV